MHTLIGEILERKKKTGGDFHQTEPNCSIDLRRAVRIKLNQKKVQGI